MSCRFVLILPVVFALRARCGYKAATHCGRIEENDDDGVQSESFGDADLFPFALSAAKGLTHRCGFQTLRCAQGERISIKPRFSIRLFVAG